MIKKYWQDICVYLFIGIYSFGAVLVAVNRYWQFNVFWYDFGIFDEGVWKLSRFQLPIIPSLHPPNGLLLWGDHFNPSSAMLAPIYWLTNRQEAIFVAQVFFVAVSAVLAYHLAKKFLNIFIVKFALVVAYLGYVGMQNALITDVHNIVFSIPFIMLCFCAIKNNQHKLYWLSLIIMLGWQESLATVGVGLGTYQIIIDRKKTFRGVVTILLSVAYGFLVTHQLIPIFGGHQYSYLPKIPENTSLFIVRLFSPVVKSQTIFYSFLTFGFIPILNLSTLPLIIEHFVERFVLNSTESRWGLGIHYSSLLSPLLFVGALETAKNFSKVIILRRLIVIWGIFVILIVFSLHRFFLHGPLLLAAHPGFFKQTDNAKFMRDFAKKIPTERILMTQNSIASHFTHQKVMLLSQNYDNIDPEVIAIDIRPGQNLNNFFPLKESEAISLARSLQKSDSKYVNINPNEYQLIFVKK